MALRTHIIAKRWTQPGSGERALTACGEPLFKSIHGGHLPDQEWEAERRIGGAVAVPSSAFYPDHDACKKCKAKWDALEV